jgi:hypothetical protein
MITILIAGLFLLFPGGIKQTMGQGDNNNDTATSNANSLTGNNTIVLNHLKLMGHIDGLTILVELIRL